MKAFSLVVILAVAALLAGASTGAVHAQNVQSAPEPSPTPMDPHMYVDLGLGSRRLRKRFLPVAESSPLPRSVKTSARCGLGD